MTVIGVKYMKTGNRLSPSHSDVAQNLQCYECYKCCKCYVILVYFRGCLVSHNHDACSKKENNVMFVTGTKSWVKTNFTNSVQ